MKRAGTRGNIDFDENTFMLVMDVSPRVVFSLPSLMFGEIFKVVWNLPNLCRQEGCFESNHIPREMGMLSSFRKLSLSVQNVS